MPRSSLATLRRAAHLKIPAKAATTVGSLHTAVTGLMIASALAPLAAFTSKTPKARKPAAHKTDRKLTSVVMQLRRAKALVPARAGKTRSKTSMRMPAGAQYLDRRHRCAAGTRAYKLYLPADQPAGLIVMLHGCNQTPDDFAIGTHMNALAEKHGLAVAYPAQTRRQNAASCWNWFKPGHQVRGIGEPAILASLTRKLMREFGLGRNTVFVAGLSSGGAMAAILADVYSDVFSAVGVHSGLVRGSAKGTMSAMSAMHSGASEGSASLRSLHKRPVRWIIFQGADDSTVHPSNAAALLTAVVGNDAVSSRCLRRSVKGRDYTRNEYAGANGSTLVESWLIEKSGHTWSGGRAGGSYTDPKGPDASTQMVRFFLAKPD